MAWHGMVLIIPIFMKIGELGQYSLMMHTNKQIQKNANVYHTNLFH
jgi:hypothetical protein